MKRFVALLGIMVVPRILGAADTQFSAFSAGPTPVAVGNHVGRVRVQVRTLDTTGDLSCGNPADPVAGWAPVTSGQQLDLGVEAGGGSTGQALLYCKGPATPIAGVVIDEGMLKARTATPTPTITNTPAPTETATPVPPTATPVPTAT